MTRTALGLGKRISPQTDAERKVLATILMPRLHQTHTAQLPEDNFGSDRPVTARLSCIARHDLWSSCRSRGHYMLAARPSSDRPSIPPWLFRTGIVADARHGTVHGHSISVQTCIERGKLVDDEAVDTVWPLQRTA